jgi:transcription termination/antitermination protein NusG
MMTDELPTTAGSPEPEPVRGTEGEQPVLPPASAAEGDPGSPSQRTEDVVEQPVHQQEEPSQAETQPEPTAEEPPSAPASVPEEALAGAEVPAEETQAEPAPAEESAGGEEETGEPVEVAVGDEQTETEPVPNNKQKWYVVKVQSGREESIKEAIERKVKIEGLEEFYGQIFIPTEKVTEMVRGQRRTRERKVLPGYIMAEVEYNDRILYLFRETTGVGDFVGGTVNRAPTPMTAKEIAQWMGKKPDKESELIKPDFEKGDRVKVKDGMFKDMEGEVKEIIEAKNQVKVELTIFGRPVNVEMEYWQVEPA